MEYSETQLGTVEDDTVTSIGHQFLDKELFVAEVERRNPVWNKFNKMHRDMSVVNALYDEICAKFSNLTREEAKRLWKNLVDQFRRHLKIVRTKPTGSARKANQAPTWAYFHQMMFMAPCIENRNTSGNYARQLLSRTMNTSSTSIDSSDTDAIDNCTVNDPSSIDEIPCDNMDDSTLPQESTQQTSSTNAADTLPLLKPMPRRGRQSDSSANVEIAKWISSSLKEVNTSMACVTDKLDSTRNKTYDPQQQHVSHMMRYCESTLLSLPKEMQENCIDAFFETVRLCSHGHQVAVVSVTNVAQNTP